MKRAMKVNIKEVEVISHKNMYTCPSCKVNCTTHIDSDVTRFRCIQCKRELIINSRKRSNL